MTLHPYQRKPGMKRVASEATIERMAKVNETETWSGVCRKCKMQVRGTLAELRKHVCPMVTEVLGVTPEPRYEGGSIATITQVKNGTPPRSGT